MALVFRRIFGRGVDGMGALSVPNGAQVPYPYSYAAESASNVTVDTALQLSSVWACTKLIAESIGSLPLKFYKVDREGTYTETKKHDLALLFAGKVNRWQNRVEFFETMAMSAVLRGNCYALKQTNRQGDIVGLQPMVADQMEVVLLEDGSVVYQYQDGAETKVFSSKRIWHVKGMGNGLIGLSPLDYMRNSVGIGQAAENSTSKIYRNGAKPGGILTIDRLLTKEQRAAIKNNFAELAEGTEDSLLVLEADMKYQQVKLSPMDIELLSTRKFQIEDVSRYFGVPKELIGASSDASAIAAAFAEILYVFYKTGLRPLLERFETSIETNLLSTGDQGKIECEFDADAFLRLSEPELVKMLKEATAGALLTPNESRKRLGEAPMEGGDNLFMQQQMFPVARLADPSRSFGGGATPSEPKPAPEGEKMQTENKGGITIVMPEMKMPEVSINLPAHMKMDIPAPIVNVEVAAPDVQVAAPTVNVEVAAPDVKIETTVTPEVRVIMPPRKTETEVTYSGDKITKTTQVERDA